MMNITVRVWSLDKRPINHWMMAASNDGSDTLTISADWYKEKGFGQSQKCLMLETVVLQRKVTSQGKGIYIMLNDKDSI